MAKINLGHVVGPQGPQGPQGPAGPKGDGIENLTNEMGSIIDESIQIVDEINNETDFLPNQIHKNQYKQVSITSNGHHEVQPDYGYSGLGVLDLDVNVKIVPKPNSYTLSPNEYGEFKKEITIDYEADWSQVRNVNRLFDNSILVNFNGTPNWDKERIRYMQETFHHARGLNEILIDLNGYTQLEALDRTFSDSDLSSITFPESISVRGMDGCFEGCRQLKEITLPNLPNLEYAGSLFNYAENITKIIIHSTPKLRGFDGAFINCFSLTDLVLDDLSNVEYFSNMFNTGNYAAPETPNGGYNLTNLTIKALPKVNLTDWGMDKQNQLTVDSLLSIINALPQLDPEQHLECKLGATNLAKLSDEQKLVATNKGWNLTE